MRLLGSCDCHNIEVAWHTVDHSLVPRACQCAYCFGKSAAYVSKSGTRVDVRIRNSRLHKTIQHGSHSADFHECTNCDQVILVTAEIDGELYGALNANKLENRFGFPAPIEVNFSSQSAVEKRERWRQNWCYPVRITTQSD